MANKLMLKDVQLMYPQLAEPKGWEGAPAKYSVKVLIPKSDKETVKKIYGAGEKEISGTSWPAQIKKSVSKIMRDNADGMNDFCLLKDGDALNVRREAEGKDPIDAYKGNYVLTTGIKASLGAPVVVDKGANQLTSMEISTEIYSGVFANVSFSFYAYSKPKAGLTTTLQGVQKMRDGDRLGGYNPFEDLTEDEEPEESAI